MINKLPLCCLYSFLSVSLIGCSDGSQRRHSVNQGALSAQSSNKNISRINQTSLFEDETAQEKATIISESKTKTSTKATSGEKSSLASFYRMEDALQSDDPCQRKPGLLDNVGVQDFTPETDSQHLLVRCSLVGFIEDACKLNELDFISNAYPTVTRENILSRTLVTQPWMLKNFTEFLNFLPDDVLPLFGSVTAGLSRYVFDQFA